MTKDHPHHSDIQTLTSKGTSIGLTNWRPHKY